MENAVGIDLGTTYSSVAFLQPDKSVAIMDNGLGGKDVRSMVSFLDDEEWVGETDADDDEEIAVMYDSKRMIGRKYDDPIIQEEKKTWPFEVVCGDGNVPMYEVQINGQTQRFSPVDISSKILKEMKSIANNFFVKDVKAAVITVPADFNPTQKEETIKAGKLAGFDKIRLLDEPTAAAVAYGYLHKSENDRKILIFDFGGGTLDVSILNIPAAKNNAIVPKFNVITTAGDSHLGGQDIDNNLVNYFLSKISDRDREKIRQSKKEMRTLKKRCEAAKKVLSSNQRTKVEITIGRFKVPIFQADLGEINRDIFERRMLIPVQKALDQAGLKKSDIDEYLLAGGSSRIPKVKDVLTRFFNKEPSGFQLNLDHEVARGAAYYASLKQIGLLEVMQNLPHSIGIEITRRKDDKYIKEMLFLLKKGTNLPAKMKKSIHIREDASEIALAVMSGEDNNPEKTCCLEHSCSREYGEMIGTHQESMCSWKSMKKEF